MNGSPELLEFYLVEATEYVDSLDHLVASPTTVPDGNAFIAAARALRGSSTMAKADAIADLALVMEQLAHGLRDGELPWSADLFRALRATVDDLRFAVRGIRTWGEREGTRTAARLADLRQFLPGIKGSRANPSEAGTTPAFVALQSSAIAAELDAFVKAPTHRRALDDALGRARTMRGIAGVEEFAPLVDVAEAIDEAGRRLTPEAPLAPADAELFRAAAAVLRKSSDDLRVSGRTDSQSAEVLRFTRAAASARSAPPTPARLVRIDELFYTDGGPHVLTRSSSPPNSPEARFRQDATPKAEHLRRLVAEGRATREVTARERTAGDLRAALTEFETLAASYGASQVAAFFGAAGREAEVLSPPLLDAIEAGARLLESSSGTLDEVTQRLALLERARHTTPIVNAAVVLRAEPIEAEPIAAPGMAAPAMASAPLPAASVPGPAIAAPPIRTPAIAVRPIPAVHATGPLRPSSAAGAIAESRAARTPVGGELRDLLSTGIQGLQSLDEESISEPAERDDTPPVPIESLLYRGRFALLRAISVRDEMRARGTIDDTALSEIFDLLDLARTE